MASTKRPNILFLMTDQQRFDTIGYINEVVKTPHLDQLAQESIMFQRAYTTNPSCVPARAAIASGRYPSQCGAPTYITYINEHETTFMKQLQQSGYYTAVIGKQHFGESEIERGYDYEDIVDIHGPKDFANMESSNSYMDFLRAAGFTRNRQLFSEISQFSHTWLAEDRYHIDHYIGERGKQWLKDDRPGDQPWYLCLSFPGPHNPFDGRGLAEEALYREDKVNLPETDASALQGKPEYYRDLLLTEGGISEADARVMRLSYYANMSMIDRKIGEVLALLKETGEYENTLIFFTSDHGDFSGDFGLVYKGQYVSEQLMRVPFLIKPPVAGFQGVQTEDFVLNFDVAPTCLAAAGVPIPRNMTAKDLSGYWRDDREKPGRTHLYMESGGVRSIRTDEWKLIHYRNRPYGELYHLKEDPWEKANLWHDDQYKKVKQSLQVLLLDELIGLGEKSDVPWNVKAPSI
jgi:arylsulfatase